MTTKHDSFDGSGHGFFVRSPHGMRNSTDRILIWVEGGTPSAVESIPARYRDNVYGPMGIEVDTRNSFIGLSSYSLVFLFVTGGRVPVRPEWLDELESFPGHVVFGEIGQISDNLPGQTRADQIAIVNSVADITGLRFGSLLGGLGVGWRYWAPVPHPLTEGMTLGLETFDAYGQVIGGAPLFSGGWVAVNGPYMLIGDFQASSPLFVPGVSHPPTPDRLVPLLFEESKLFHRNLVDKWPESSSQQTASVTSTAFAQQNQSSISVLVDQVRVAAQIDGGVQRITLPGFGMPKAAIVLMSGCSQYGTPQSGADISIGITDGVRGYCHINTSEDNHVPSWGSHSWSTRRLGAMYGKVSPPPDLPNNQYIETAFEFRGFVEDGLDIEWTLPPPTPYLITVILLGGDGLLAAKVGEFESSAIPDETVRVSDVGFQPDQLIVMSNHSNLYDEPNPSTHESVSIVGFVDRVGNQQCSSATNCSEGSSPTQVLNFVSSSYGIRHPADIWAVEFGGFSGDGFSATMRGVPQVNPWKVGYLALKYHPLIPHFVGIVDSPTRTGRTVVQLGFEPSCVLHLLSGVDKANFTRANTAAGAGSFAVAALTTGKITTHGYTEQDGVSPTETTSYSHTRIHLRRGDGVVMHDAASFAAEPSGYRATYRVVDATPRKWPTLAIGQVEISRLGAVNP